MTIPTRLSNRKLRNENGNRLTPRHKKETGSFYSALGLHYLCTRKKTSLFIDMKSIFRSDSDREPPLACQLRVVEADFSIPTSGNASGTICRDSRGRLAYHFLRRPISINYVDRQRNEVWFLIQLVGDGTKRLGEAKQAI